MKNTIFRIVLIFGAVILLSSCFTIPRTHKLVVEPDNPTGQNVIITFRNGAAIFAVQKFNNIEVREKLYPKDKITHKDKSVLTVPAGENSFVFHVVFVSGNSTNSFRDVELRYNLETGKEYQVEASTKSISWTRAEFLVGIYDVTGKKTQLKEWKLGES
jgi:hypothetical protein